MGFLVKGTPGNPYHFRVIVHAEYIGSPVQGRATPSEADVAGFQATNSANRHINSLERATGYKIDSLKEMTRLVGEELRHAFPDVSLGDVARGVLSMASGAAAAYMQSQVAPYLR